MTEQEIEERIEVCEKCERDYREVGNTRRADAFSNEKYKWEKLLDKLNPKRDEQLADYKKGYNSLEQALNEIKGIIEDCKKLMPHEFDWEEQADNILEKIDKVLGEEQC